MNQLESPQMYSDLFGALQIGDPLPVVVEFGAAGDYLLGSVMALDSSGKAVLATDASSVYGILLQARYIEDLETEPVPSAVIARHGSFRADQLHTAEGVSLEALAPLLREKGIYLEGLAYAALGLVEEEETE